VNKHNRAFRPTSWSNL